jgi:hypothetical protein
MAPLWAVKNYADPNSVENLKCRATQWCCGTIYLFRSWPAEESLQLYETFFLFSHGVSWVHLVLRPLFGLLYQPQMTDDDDCGAIGGMRTGRVNRSTRRKPAPVPLRPPQIPHDLTRARTEAAAVGSRRLTAWAMARPLWNLVSVMIRGTYPWLFWTRDKNPVFNFSSK